jgi:streptomycin 6-kinase
MIVKGLDFGSEATGRKDRGNKLLSWRRGRAVTLIDSVTDRDLLGEKGESTVIGFALKTNAS